MTNEERLKAALFMIGNNLVGDGLDGRPLSYKFACEVAALAFAVAEGKPHERFDAACAEVKWRLGNEQPLALKDL